MKLQRIRMAIRSFLVQIDIRINWTISLYKIARRMDRTRSQALLQALFWK